MAASLREQARASAGLRNISAKLTRLTWNLEAIYIMELEDYRASLKAGAAQRAETVRPEEGGRGMLWLVRASDPRTA